MISKRLDALLDLLSISEWEKEAEETEKKFINRNITSPAQVAPVETEQLMCWFI